jgi:hypothetical protein
MRGHAIMIPVQLCRFQDLLERLAIRPAKSELTWVAIVSHASPAGILSARVFK